jgi:hypothetical protein
MTKKVPKSSVVNVVTIPRHEKANMNAIFPHQNTKKGQNGYKMMTKKFHSITLFVSVDVNTNIVRVCGGIL